LTVSKSASTADGPITDAEADVLFADLAGAPALVLAVSGGPDSTALLVLLARWRQRQSPATRLTAVTVDHGLRPEARREAVAVKRLATGLGVLHRTRRWTGLKPATGLQEKARMARYRLLQAAARTAGAPFVLTAHTLDDQAETVLLRLLRGSGVGGIGGMARQVRLSDVLGTGPPSARSEKAKSGATATASPAVSRTGAAGYSGMAEVCLVRPLLGVAKLRLVATLREAGVSHAEDPSNRDPRFTRARLRNLMPALAAEGLTVGRLDRLARRLRRGDLALEAATDQAAKRLGFAADAGRIVMPRQAFAELPDEIALRLLGRAIDRLGNEGPVELGKLEALCTALGEALAAAGAGAPARFRRTLAGAMVSLQKNCIIVERAPPRQCSSGTSATTGRHRGF
jgi:tRNA(Ile)-lysidine synthase